MAEPAQKRDSVLVTYDHAHDEDEVGFGLGKEDPEDLHRHMTEDDKAHDDNEKAHHEGWNSLADKQRGRCTDMTFLVRAVL
jgi:hypothetical protein